MPNVFGIADDILVIGYDKDITDHDKAVYSVLKWCQDINLKLNKDKCHFRCTSIPFFGEVVSREGIKPDPQKIRALTKMPVPKNKRELQSFLGIVNYLSKFSLGTAEVCKPLRKLTSSKTTWTWNASYQQLFDKAKSLIKTKVCMKFYDDTKPLYLETDASGVSLGAALLQLCNNMTYQKGLAPDNTILCPIAFASKSSRGAEWRYSNIEHEALKFHHYCFDREVLVITDHRPLVSMFKKDVATFSQCMQCILLKIHQYRVQIIYKPGPKIFIADWVSRHKDKPTKDMDVCVDAIQSVTDIPECVSMAEIQQESTQDNHIQHLKNCIIAGWPNMKDELHVELKPYWLYRDELAVIDGIILKGRHIVIPQSLRQQILEQLHTNHMGIEKTKLLACESVYWSSINADMENFIKNCATCLQFQQTEPKEKIIHHDIPLRPWEVVSTDVFQFNNKNYLCIVDYYSKFLVIKSLEGLSVENLINAVKIIFAKYGIPR